MQAPLEKIASGSGLDTAERQACELLAATRGIDCGHRD